MLGFDFMSVPFGLDTDVYPEFNASKRLDHYILDVDPNFQSFVREQMYENYNNPSTLIMSSAKEFASVLTEAFNRGIDDINSKNPDMSIPYIAAYVFEDDNGDVSFFMGGRNGEALTFSGCDPAIIDGSIGHSFLHSLSGTTMDYQYKEVSDLWIQSGANSQQAQYYTIEAMRTECIGIRGASVHTRTRADECIKQTDNTLAVVSRERSKIGANVNRLEHQYDNATNTSENVQAAESRIRDTDMAKEMVTLAKSQILAQASQAMLAQANNSTQGVLKLIQQ